MDPNKIRSIRALSCRSMAELVSQHLVEIKRHKGFLCLGLFLFMHWGITAQEKSFLALNAKTQFPIQHALGFEIITKKGLSFSFGIGQLSRGYTVAAMNFLKAENENDERRKQFIQDKMNNGLVVEFGSNYYPKNTKDFYFGVNLQLQRFTLPATTQELIENYGFADQIDQENLDDALENSLVEFFYENTIVEPIVKPVQLGLLVGKKFGFKKIPNLFLLAELNYQFNLNTNTTFDSPTVVGQIIVDSFIEPNFDPSTQESFEEFNLPSLSIKLQYRIDASSKELETGFLLHSLNPLESSGPLPSSLLCYSILRSNSINLVECVLERPVFLCRCKA